MTVALYAAGLFCFVCAAWAIGECIIIAFTRRRPVRDDDGHWRAP